MYAMFADDPVIFRFVHPMGLFGRRPGRRAHKHHEQVPQRFPVERAAKKALAQRFDAPRAENTFVKQAENPVHALIIQRLFAHHVHEGLPVFRGDETVQMRRHQHFFGIVKARRSPATAPARSPVSKSRRRPGRHLFKTLRAGAQRDEIGEGGGVACPVFVAPQQGCCIHRQGLARRGGFLSRGRQQYNRLQFRGIHQLVQGSFDTRSRHKGDPSLRTDDNA